MCDSVTARKRIFSLIGSWSLTNAFVSSFISYSAPCVEHQTYVERETFEANKKPMLRIMYDFIDLFDIKATIEDSKTDRPIVRCCAHSQTWASLFFYPGITGIHSVVGAWKNINLTFQLGLCIFVHWCDVKTAGELATEKYICGKAMAIQLQIGASNEIIFIIRFRWTHNANSLWLRRKRQGRGREHQELCHSTQCMRNNNIYSVQTTAYTN